VERGSIRELAPAGEPLTFFARTRLPPWLGVAAAVAGGYYLGVQAGLLLRLPPSTTSLLWPPNAVLTSALVLTPYRRWPICLAAVLPAHVIAELSTGWPMAMIVALFFTNCSEALIAAMLIRRWNGPAIRFDTLRGASAFVLSAAVVAPIVSSFADAAVVRFFLDEPYWLVWHTRVFANALTELGVVPLIVLGAGGAALIPQLRRRIVEVLLFGSALIAATQIVFWSAAMGWSIPHAPPTPSVFLLPLFLWAAVRFGAAGISVTLLVSAVMACVAARMGNRPFQVLGPHESVIALQTYLIVMAAPLYAFAALLGERRLAVTELAARLRSEALLSWVSGNIVRKPGGVFSETLELCLERIGEAWAADRVVIVIFSKGGDELLVPHQWVAPGVGRLDARYQTASFPWAVARVLGGSDVLVDRLATLPAEADHDRESALKMGVHSALAIPLVVSGEVIGSLSIHAVRGPRVWNAESIAQLRVLAEVIATALDRQRSEDALRASESMNTAILTSLTSLVAVLDRDGVIIAANARWRTEIRRQGEAGQRLDVGANYLDLWHSLRSAGGALLPGCYPDAGVAGLGNVLAGTADRFECEYMTSDGEDHWYTMAVVPLRRPAGGAVVTHVNITERKRAELDAQRSRQQLAHYSRVSTMGELTASLAHQLNQPLASILNNAEAARLMLQNGETDLAEIAQILADIVDDDVRASDVIRRLRAMMSKTTIEHVVLDVNGVIREVATLMTSDAIIRNVSVTFDLDANAPLVRGDRIELQQVILNLLVNAIDAVTGRPVRERQVVVRSRSEPDEYVVVSVHDSGFGFGPEVAVNMFEPFFSTKTGGMGMGLAIARSIVEAHDGGVWAENNPDKGATFFVRLPLAPGQAA
jgi:signal transduction histidine kinase/integral membrane sensor domain MASE1